MRILIRTDAYPEIGSGHVMRCITLANRLKKWGWDISFVMRDFPGNMNDTVANSGFRLYQLPLIEKIQFNAQRYETWLGTSWEEDFLSIRKLLFKERVALDWVIVDHYGIDHHWENEIRGFTKKIFVIDDLANRQHTCDVILDQNLYDQMTYRYKGLVPEGCIQLLGPQYALLREEFIKVRQLKPINRTGINRIMIFFGGSDPTNETGKVLDAILSLGTASIRIDIVLGDLNQNAEAIAKTIKGKENIFIHRKVTNISELIYLADICIGAGGTNTWERCCLGLPTIAVAIADNQQELLRYAHKRGLVYYLGTVDQVTVLDYVNILKYVLNHPQDMRNIRNQCLDLFRDYEKNLTTVSEVLMNV